ncbi:MAG: hypothetical protein QM752_07260 [Gammaproteobacteria bacterium]
MNMGTARPERPIQERRLDSIAALIRANDQCAAACFDGEKLLLATNSDEKSYMAEEVLKYLKFVARKSHQLKESGEKYQKDYTMYHYFDFGKKKLTAKANETVKLLIKDNKNYKNFFKDSLNKVTRSIVYSYLRPHKEKAFPIELSEAIREGGRRCTFPSLVRSKNAPPLHAEMKILDYLLMKKTSHVMGSYYIGVSKKCCQNCTAAFKAIRNLMVLGKNWYADIPPIDYGETHDNYYPALIPEFLHENNERGRAIRREFLKNLGIAISKDDSQNLWEVQKAFSKTKSPEYYKNKKRESHDRSKSYDGSSAISKESTEEDEFVEIAAFHEKKEGPKGYAEAAFESAYGALSIDLTKGFFGTGQKYFQKASDTALAAAQQVTQAAYDTAKLYGIEYTTAKTSTSTEVLGKSMSSSINPKAKETKPKKIEPRQQQSRRRTAKI